MLDLLLAELPEPSFVAHFGEAQRIEVAQGCHGTNLLRRVERWQSGALIRHSDCRQTELLHGILSSSKLSSENAQDTDHSKAAIANLLVPHVCGVHVNAE